MAKPLIDWNDEESHVFVNPQLPDSTKKQLHDAVLPYLHLKGHIWLASSGTESFPKMIALSKKAMLTSADGVNAHLKIQKEDSWLNILPLFHAGGLGIHARAFLSGSSLWDYSENKWDPVQYVNLLNEFNISFSSLTPTHIYDLVFRKLSPPKSLKAIIVGGGGLPETLHEQAFELGWPLLKSYGMTETCSQIATALLPNPSAKLEVLKHIELRFNTEGFIEIRSQALLTGFIHGNDPEKEFIDPKVNGWYTTQDKGILDHGNLQIYGRGANFMKIGGENISFSQLEEVWDNIRAKNHCEDDIVLIDLPDERLGKIICLATTVPKEKEKYDALIKSFHDQVIPIAKIRRVYFVEKLPRSELFKLKKNELREFLTTLSEESYRKI